MDNLAQYQQMHRDNTNFRGLSLLPHVERIGELVKATHSLFLLDYGCGKAHQYLVHKAHVAWDVPMPLLYDPGIPKWSVLPTGPFHGVICTDVLEHLEGKDLYENMSKLFGKAERFVFLSICTRPARKTLPDGRNAHLTVETESWWDAVIDTYQGHYPDLKIEVAYT